MRSRQNPTTIKMWLDEAPHPSMELLISVLELQGVANTQIDFPHSRIIGHVFWWVVLISGSKSYILFTLQII